MIDPAARMQDLAANFFVGLSTRIAALQAAGQDVIRLDEGSPDLPPPAHIIAALAQSAADPRSHGYQAHRGPQALREAWAEMYRARFQVELDPDREIVPLIGSKEGIFHLSMAFVNPGDVVLIPDPGYVTYTRAALFAGGQPYYLPLLPENHYLPDLEAIPPEVIARAKLLWLNYPHNPTAAVAPLAFIAQAVAFAQDHQLLLCHDAAYTQVTFDGYQAPSLMQIPAAREVAVEFNSLSKSHNMAGWRVGAAVGNARSLRSLFKLKTNLDSGQFLPIHAAVIAALTGDQTWITGRNDIYRQRRDAAIQALHAQGLQAAIPKASLYVWSPIPRGWTAEAYTLALLEKTYVSLTPGTFFGNCGEGYLRIALTAPTERIVEAMHRLESLPR
jgi:LL-diaminopimelate aminotransferase